MRFVLWIATFLVANAIVTAAYADRAQCVKELSKLMKSVEKDVRSMPKQDAKIHKYCVMWLYERASYDIEKQKTGGDPCPSGSADWKKILGMLIGAYGDAKSICNDKNVCDKGCGKALSIIRSGGSTAQALKAIPND